MEGKSPTLLYGYGGSYRALLLPSIMSPAADHTPEGNEMIMCVHCGVCTRCYEGVLRDEGISHGSGISTVRYMHHQGLVRLIREVAKWPSLRDPRSCVLSV